MLIEQIGLRYLAYIHRSIRPIAKYKVPLLMIDLVVAFVLMYLRLYCRCFSVSIVFTEFSEFTEATNVAQH